MEGASTSQIRNKVFVRITEQPAPKALRFRYECEGRSAGSIPGASSTPENRTYPTIEIVGYRGKATVLVSCVTKDKPYKPHPHNIVGKGEGFKDGIFSKHFDVETMSCTFKSLGIQCVKKLQIEESLRTRYNIKVNPFKRVLDLNNTSAIDLTAVRLAFQVFLRGQERYDIPLETVVSEPIYDKKSNTDLTICKLSHCSSSCAGGQEIILLCEKVVKEDIKVKFFEEIDNKTVWEDYGTFIQSSVHKQVAISLKTPKYNRVAVESVAKCFIQLERPSDGRTSDPLPFDFTPYKSDTIELKRKRQRMDPDSYLLKHLHTQVNQQQQLPSNVQALPVEQPTTSNRFNISPNPPNPSSVKLEPRETSPPTTNYNIFPGPSVQNTNNYRVQQSTPSPQFYSQGGAAGYTANNFATNTFEGQQNINYIQNNCQVNYQNFDQQQNWNLYPQNNSYLNQNQQQFNLQPESTNVNYPLPYMYNQYVMTQQDSMNIPENLSELIDPKMNVTELSGSTLQKEFRSNIEVDQENMTDSFGKLLN